MIDLDVMNEIELRNYILVLGARFLEKSNELATIKEQYKWLPIETAPEVGNILIRYRDGSISSNYKQRAMNWVEIKEKTGAVIYDWETPTHWMPLPELPKNEG